MSNILFWSGKESKTVVYGAIAMLAIYVVHHVIDNNFRSNPYLSMDRERGHGRDDDDDDS